MKKIVILSSVALLLTSSWVSASDREVTCLTDPESIAQSLERYGFLFRVSATFVSDTQLSQAKVDLIFPKAGEQGEDLVDPYSQIERVIESSPVLVAVSELRKIYRAFDITRWEDRMLLLVPNHLSRLEGPKFLAFLDAKSPDDGSYVRNPLRCEFKLD